MTLGEIIIALLGAGGLGGIAAAWAKGRKAREASATAVVPDLLERMGAQDRRLDAQGDEIKSLREEVADCHHKHEQCEETTREQGGVIVEQGKVIKELQAMVLRSNRDITQRIETAARRVVRQSDTALLAYRDPDEIDTKPETPVGRARLRVQEFPAPSSKNDPRRK